MHPFTRLLNSMATWLLADISGEPVGFLLHPGKHPPLLSRYRAETIISRVRLMAALFAVLTPLWIMVDVIVFSLPISVMLAGGRLAATLAFVALALAYKNSPHLRDAYRSLAFLFIIPTAFFFYSHLLLVDYETSGGAAVIAAGYAFLPFVLVAGLSIFPLTALEGIVFAMPVLVTSGMLAFARSNDLDVGTHVGAFWLLLLIAGTATLAAMSLLAFMAALVRQANHDPLTHCFNRASGEELLNLQFSNAERSNMPLAVVFVDLDKFKSVNDEYGHDAGDQLLIRAVDTIRGSLRNGDALIRWGGEEFLILLPNTDCLSAVALLERLRTSGLGPRPDGMPVTASYGIAERVKDGASDISRLLEIADQRMYQAKDGGRNRWIGCSTSCTAAAEASCRNAI